MSILECFGLFNRQYYEDKKIAKDILKYISNNHRIASKDVESAIPDIEEYIRSIRNRKFRHITVLKEFVKFYNKKYNKSIKVNISKEYSVLTRRIELIKFLQQPHTREDILGEFLINERTLNDDFSNLEKGIDVLGCQLQVKFLKYDRQGRFTVDDYSYHSSCNPIFMPLNMTELFFLTNIVPAGIKNTMMKNNYLNIIKKIYPQLSDYSASIINVDNSDDNKTFVFEYDLLKNNVHRQLDYLYKRANSVNATFIYSENGATKTFVGYLKRYLDDECFVVANAKEEAIIKFEDFIAIENFKDIYC